MSFVDLSNPCSFILCILLVCVLTTVYSIKKLFCSQFEGTVFFVNISKYLEGHLKLCVSLKMKIIISLLGPLSCSATDLDLRNDTRHEFHHVEMDINPIRKWLVISITPMIVFSYGCMYRIFHLYGSYKIEIKLPSEHQINFSNV